jgi:hypothetical protein
MPPPPPPPFSGGPKHPKNGIHISALAGIEVTDKIDAAAANDKAIRLVFIGEVSLTLALPTQQKFYMGATDRATPAIAQKAAFNRRDVS